MDRAQLLVTLLGAGGGGAVLLALINGSIKWLSGAAGRERARNTSVEAQRVDAVERAATANARADAEAVKRRKVEEALSAARRQLIENGIAPGEWPIERTIRTK